MLPPNYFRRAGHISAQRLCMCHLLTKAGDPHGSFSPSFCVCVTPLRELCPVYLKPTHNQPQWWSLCHLLQFTTFRDVLHGGHSLSVSLEQPSPPSTPQEAGSSFCSGVSSFWGDLDGGWTNRASGFRFQMGGSLSSSCSFFSHLCHKAREQLQTGRLTHPTPQPRCEEQSLWEGRAGLLPGPWGLKIAQHDP